jgi:hypothetical protein
VAGPPKHSNCGNQGQRKHGRGSTGATVPRADWAREASAVAAGPSTATAAAQGHRKPVEARLGRPVPRVTKPQARRISRVAGPEPSTPTAADKQRLERQQQASWRSKGCEVADDVVMALLRSDSRAAPAQRHLSGARGIRDGVNPSRRAAPSAPQTQPPPARANIRGPAYRRPPQRGYITDSGRWPSGSP